MIALAEGLGLGVTSSWPTTVLVPQTLGVLTVAVTLQPSSSSPPDMTAVVAPHTKVAVVERGRPVSKHTSPPEKTLPE